MGGMFICQEKDKGWKPGLPGNQRGCEKNNKSKNSVFTFQCDLVLISVKTNTNTKESDQCGSITWLLPGPALCAFQMC